MTIFFDYKTHESEDSDGVKKWTDRFTSSGGEYKILDPFQIANSDAPSAEGTLHMNLEATFIEDPNAKQNYLTLKTEGAMNALPWQQAINDNAAYIA